MAVVTREMERQVPASRSVSPPAWGAYIAAYNSGEKNLSRFRTAALVEFRAHLEREFVKITKRVHAEEDARMRGVVRMAGAMV